MGGLVYHVLNRGAGRRTIFRKDADYAAFERVLSEACQRMPMRLVSYCLMPNHWHMVLWPRGDDDLSEFMRWLTVTHTQRWHAHHHTSGTGPLYQGRFKSFPIQRDDHFLTVCRYVERNALRANLVTRAQDWRWSSLWVRRCGQADLRSMLTPPASWPVQPPRAWTAMVNAPQLQEEEETVERSVKRGTPCGDERWQHQTAERLGLGPSLRPSGRPGKGVGSRFGSPEVLRTS